MLKTYALSLRSKATMLWIILQNHHTVPRLFASLCRAKLR